MIPRLQIPAAVTALKTLADRTIRLTVDLGRELNPEQSAAVFALLHLEGWMLFQPTPIDENTVDVPDVVPDFKGEKTPAQRLRGTLYRVWETTDRKITFEQFYRESMERIIEHYKGKLE